MSPEEFMRAYEAATNAHDLDGTLALIADEAIYLFSDGTAHVGKPAVQAVLEANFAAIRNETYQIGDLRWLARTDEFAACVYVFEWSGEIEGKAASGQGRGTSVLRQGTGGWQVVHEHLSSGRLG